MLVNAVVLRSRRAAIAATVFERADAIDTPSTGTIFAILADDNASALDTLDCFVGQIMIEAASATATVDVGAVYNAAVVEETNAAAEHRATFPHPVPAAIVESASATTTQDAEIGGLNAFIVETAIAEDWPFSGVLLPAKAGAALEGVFVDPSPPATLLGADILDSGPVSIFIAGDTGGIGGNPGTPETGIPLSPPDGGSNPEGAASGGPGTWTVPDDWNNASNSIEVFGGGAGGCCYRPGNMGGGGGAYSKITNLTLTPGAIISFHIGEGGKTQLGNGGDTWFKDTATVYAQGGRGQTGGQASAGIGTVKYSGGQGGGGSTYGAGGGGGAGGPNGDGAYGGAGAGGVNAYGAGGGGNSGGAPGQAVSAGGAGGNSFLGTGGGAHGTAWPNTSGAPGEKGGGGGGAATIDAGGDLYYTGDGGKGGNGREYGRNIGSGGGGGGGGCFAQGGHGGYYGGGGGGASPFLFPMGLGGEGAAGVIIVRYDPL